ncbi:hypothetical protein [Acinetobacter sp. WCHAc010052]|uniref:hypothetical protein n=1 Tax=Acinetobacter sp. WCHAc010052 TaxID=2004647 RepID=UPI000B3C0F16|nr:hypothetical protein [Acinetobacter sp. WCHAc010052]AXY60898.1 hypothetical protein CDG61_13265 [Acinetobacter sp. WCHAc010052]
MSLKKLNHHFSTSILWGITLGCFSMAGHAAFWQSNQAGVSWSNQYQEPANPDNVSKTILNFTHLSGDDLGRNVLVANLYLSSDEDPKADGDGGATEYYVFYRRYFSYNSIFDHKIENKLIRDVNLTFRVDKGLKNSALEPNPTKGRAGLSMDFNVPKGYFEAGADWYYESANNNFTGGRFNFDPTYALWANFGFPVHDKGFVDGFVDYVGATGPGYFNVDAKPSTLFQINYMYDVGAKEGLKVGVGYEYFRNKYLNDNQKDPYGHATHSAPFVAARYSF